MQINRALQETILKHLTECFPGHPEHSFYSELIAIHGEKEVVGTILYLQMHNLLECKESAEIGHGIPDILWGLTRPTAKAFDFLANDGGLSAILGVVTVKLHSDTIQALVAAKIDQAEISDTEKSRLKTELGKIKDTALSTLTENIINAIPAAQLISVLKSAISP
ncbi:hypothetical protein [Neisseria leonii]|uniref:hypothetical protein n=1 Tax=Neisseria leonii TaxID=2995413 RepID=UPI00237AC7D8|nr:hypothetical protein [Neisseria sp. 3986]MDD9325624.1 hypothetical protein [Neisseria sp. 3986]